MNKRTFAIPVAGAAGLCLATACGSDPIAGSWELTNFTDGAVVRELPRFTETGDNYYNEFGSIVVGDDLRGALTLISYVSDYYGPREEFSSSIFSGTEVDKRTYELVARGDLQVTFMCEVGDDADGDEELTCNGEQTNLQSASITARRFAAE
ncbi:MAG: hypothetical protein ACJAZO_000221 [Myxococcota bacterium]|jgi:hypothetical protein